MPTRDQYTLDIAVDARKIEAGIRNLNKDMGTLNRRTDQTNDELRKLNRANLSSTTRGLQQMTRGMNALRTAAAGAVAQIGFIATQAVFRAFGALTGGISNAAESMTALRNRTLELTGTLEATNEQMATLLNIANSTTRDIDEIGKNFIALTNALQGTRFGIEDINTLLRGVGNAADFAGASTTEAGQVIQSVLYGAVQGIPRSTSLIALAQSMPEFLALASEAAKDFGVIGTASIQEFGRAIQQRRIEGDNFIAVLVEAARRATALQKEQEFVSDGATVLTNNLKNLVGEVNANIEGGAQLSQALREIGQSIGDATPAIVRGITAITKAFAALTTGILTTITTFDEFVSSANQSIGGIRAVGETSLRGSTFDRAREFLGFGSSNRELTPEQLQTARLLQSGLLDDVGRRGASDSVRAGISGDQAVEELRKGGIELQDSADDVKRGGNALQKSAEQIEAERRLQFQAEQQIQRGDLLRSQFELEIAQERGRITRNQAAEEQKVITQKLALASATDKEERRVLSLQLQFSNRLYDLELSAIAERRRRQEEFTADQRNQFTSILNRFGGSQISSLFGGGSPQELGLNLLAEVAGAFVSEFNRAQAARTEEIVRPLTEAIASITALIEETNSIAENQLRATTREQQGLRDSTSSLSAINQTLLGLQRNLLDAGATDLANRVQQEIEQNLQDIRDNERRMVELQQELVDIERARDYRSRELETQRARSQNEEAFIRQVRRDFTGEDESIRGGLETVRNLFGFQSGGYTGAGAPNQVAGVAHAGEFILPQRFAQGVVGGREVVINPQSQRQQPPVINLNIQVDPEAIVGSYFDRGRGQQQIRNVLAENGVQVSA